MTETKNDSSLAPENGTKQEDPTGYPQMVELMYEPLSEADLAAGKEPAIIGGFIPVLDPLTMAAKLATMANQMALDLASDPQVCCPEPPPDLVKQMTDDIKSKVERGLLPPEALHIDPAFQIKYQFNAHNLLAVLLQFAAGQLERQYNKANPSRIQTTLALPPGMSNAPGSAIMLAR